MLAISALFALSVAFASENSDSTAEPSRQMSEKPARQSSRDVRMPKALVARLEKEYREFLKTNQVVIKDGIKRRLLTVQAEFSQKRPAALHEDVRVVTPLGGGVIDLAEIVTPLRGAFHLRLVAKHDQVTELPGMRVFFVSGSRERILGGEEYGAGCGKFMEITSFFNKKMSAQGFELFSAEQRYASVIGGTFVLVAFEIDALNVASVTFNDSRYPELFCE